MAVNEHDMDWFEETFELKPKNETGGGDSEENEQAEEYGHSSGSDEPFEELASQVFEDIENSDDKGASLGRSTPKDIINNVCTEESCPIPEPDKQEEGVEGDMFAEECSDDIDDTVPDDKADDMFEDDGVEPEPKPEPKPVSKPLIPPKSYLELDANPCAKIEWKLNSPSEMYESLYAKKRELLSTYMVGGQVEYKRWMDELAEAKVDMRGEVFDPVLVIEQMEEVQMHRERVKYIQIRVNNQFYMFKRYIEMMKGFLARIEYLKPVLKQDGLIMEHMLDLEIYFARLEALHESANKTERTLGAAFETLSRKATICMELKPAERAARQQASSYRSDDEEEEQEYEGRTEDLGEFDDLPNKAVAAPLDHKTGSIGWDEV